MLVAGDEPVAEEQAVLEFLNGDLVLPWAEAVLGLQSSSLANDLGWRRQTQGAQASTTSQFRAPNIHFCSIKDFRQLCDVTGAKMEKAVALNAWGSPLRLNAPWWLWNLFGEQAVFLLSRKI